MKKVKLSLAGTKVVEKWKIWISIPIAVIIIALIAFSVFAGINKDAGKGINLGIDFTGGNIVTIQFKDNLTDQTYKENLKIATNVLKENGAELNYAQQGGDKDLIVRFGLLSKDNAENEKLNNDIVADMEKAFEGKLASGENSVRLEYNGPSARNDLILTALLSVLVSTILILIYVIIRFRNVFTGLSAVIALIHDVLMVFALTTIFHIQINSSFVAAIITILAYSINNTIVLFDRVRLNYKNTPAGAEFSRNYHNGIVNKSIAQTLSRSILTTVTTMAAIVILAIIGVPSIREFALPVIFGLIAGAFSSIFLAPSLYCLMKNASGDKDGYKKKKEKAPKRKRERKVNEPISDTNA